MSNDNAWCPENDLVWIMEQVERRACFMVEENRKLRARLAEAEAQRDALKVALGQANTKLSSVRDELYGRGFEVLGWHLNGATERLDSWFEANDWEPVHCEAIAKLEEK